MQLPCLPPAVTRKTPDGVTLIRRFTYVYQKQADGMWKATVQHLSAPPMPDAPIAAFPKEVATSVAATEKQVGTRPAPAVRQGGQQRRCSRAHPVPSTATSAVGAGGGGAVCAVLTSAACRQVRLVARAHILLRHFSRLLLSPADPRRLHELGDHPAEG